MVCLLIEEHLLVIHTSYVPLVFVPCEPCGSAKISELATASSLRHGITMTGHYTSKPELTGKNSSTCRPAANSLAVSLMARGPYTGKTSL